MDAIEHLKIFEAQLKEEKETLELLEQNLRIQLQPSMDLVTKLWNLRGSIGKYGRHGKIIYKSKKLKLLIVYRSGDLLGYETGWFSKKLLFRSWSRCGGADHGTFEIQEVCDKTAISKLNRLKPILVDEIRLKLRNDVLRQQRRAEELKEMIHG
jgi:hypothetical protein